MNLDDIFSRIFNIPPEIQTELISIDTYLKLQDNKYEIEIENMSAAYGYSQAYRYKIKDCDGFGDFLSLRFHYDNTYNFSGFKFNIFKHYQSLESLESYKPKDKYTDSNSILAALKYYLLNEN